jgi:hypothetical protein
MVSITHIRTVQISSETAGFPNLGALIGAVTKSAVAASRAARAFAKVGGRSGGQRWQKLRSGDKNIKASDNAVNSAKSSETVKKILKSETFQVSSTQQKFNAEEFY